MPRLYLKLQKLYIDTRTFESGGQIDEINYKISAILSFVAL